MQKPAGLPDHPVVEELRTWRQDQARAADVELYDVFPNATIDSLLRVWPGTKKDLLDVHGIGPYKADRFGTDLLAILAGHDRPEMPAPPAKAPRSRAPAAVHGDLDPDLVEALRAWRLEQVFANATMHELAATRPTTTDELLAVSGIGPAKAERFGAELLAFLAEQP